MIKPKTAQQSSVPKPRSHRAAPTATVPSRGAMPQHHHSAYTGNAAVGNSSSTIKAMQQAILDFASKAETTSSTTFDNSGKQEGNQVYSTPNPSFDPSKPESETNSKTVKSKEFLGGADPFGRFLTNNYINTSNPVGKQYLNVDVMGQKNRDDNSMENASLKGIIDSIKRIGSPGTNGTEKSVDGIWKGRTQIALQNIYAVVSGVVQAAHDMGLDNKLPQGSAESLAQYKKLLPAKYTDLSDADKANVAKDLTPLIVNFGNIFDSFKTTVLSNKRFKDYIDQDKSFVQYKHQPKDGQELLDDKEKSLYNSNRSTPIPGVMVGKTQVKLSDLESMENFKALLTNAGVDAKNPAEVQKILAQITQNLSGNKPGA